MTASDPSHTIIQEITINAPARRIFDALTDPLQRVKWWGAPGAFQTTHMDSDLRPGGAWQMRGTGPGGAPFTLSGEYRSINAPHSLEFTWLHEAPGPSLVTLVRFDLEQKGDSTTVRLTHSGLTTEQSRQTYKGWPWILALLKGYVDAQ